MDFKAKYISQTELADEIASLPEGAEIKDDRIMLSNDAYAITEFIDLLIKKIEHFRTS